MTITALPIVLLAILMASAFGKCWGAFKTSAALLLNWAINSSFVSATDIQLPWYFFGSVDYLTAIAILGLGQNRCNIIIAALYAIEMIAHSSFAFSSGGAWPQYRYYYALLFIAWAQTLVTGGWMLYGLAQAWMRRGNGVRGVQPLSESSVRTGLPQ